MQDVLVLTPCLPRAQEQLEAAYRLHRYDLADADGRAAMLDEVGDRITAIVASGHARIDRALLDRLPNVGVVACSSAGYENIDAAALAERGIALTNSSPALYDDVADMAILLMLAARRNLVRAHEYVASGDWGEQGMFPLQHRVAGSKLGIVGIGQIGQAIARRAEPMGLDIAYFARRARDLPWRFEPDLMKLATDSDMLIVITPGGAETRHMISAEVMAALGPQGVLVNVARGSVIDEKAMIEALKSGALGAAGLDVFENEPNPDPALTALPNVTLYPHHASGTVETRDAMHQTVVDNLAAFYARQPLLTQVA